MDLGGWFLRPSRSSELVYSVSWICVRLGYLVGASNLVMGAEMEKAENERKGKRESGWWSRGRIVEGER
jgi:hypothetical protein